MIIVDVDGAVMFLGKGFCFTTCIGILVTHIHGFVCFIKQDIAPKNMLEFLFEW
jgi:hypothetical protein